MARDLERGNNAPVLPLILPNPFNCSKLQDFVYRTADKPILPWAIGPVSPNGLALIMARFYRALRTLLVSASYQIVGLFRLDGETLSRTEAYSLVPVIYTTAAAVGTAAGSGS
jgi:hypothetical protein